MYNTRRVTKVRAAMDMKRNFLTALFFSEKIEQDKRTVRIEMEKNGEYFAPFVTKMESGRPMPDTTIKTNDVEIPEVAPEYTLKPDDYYKREAGQEESVDVVRNVLNKIKRILTNQENYITNKEELMVSQFLTTGKITSIGKEAEVEIDYQVSNIGVLPVEEQWNQATATPKLSLEKMIMDAEECGTKVGAVVMGWEAGYNFENSLDKDKEFSKDNQTEWVKKQLRQYPGVIWIGTWNKFGIELFRYTRNVKNSDDNSNVALMPQNMVVGGPIGGTMLYGSIINTSIPNTNPVKVGARFAWKDSTTAKTEKITTSSAFVLQPLDPDSYFAYEVL